MPTQCRENVWGGRVGRGGKKDLTDAALSGNQQRLRKIVATASGVDAGKKAEGAEGWEEYFATSSEGLKEVKWVPEKKG